MADASDNAAAGGAQVPTPPLCKGSGNWFCISRLLTSSLIVLHPLLNNWIQSHILKGSALIIKTVVGRIVWGPLPWVCLSRYNDDLY